MIIGLGNADCGDDAAGLLVAHNLAERGIEAMAYTGSMLDLIDLWRSARHVILIDAVLSGAQPGTIHVWDPRLETLHNDAPRSSTHALGLAETIELARVLDRLPDKLTIYGIECVQFAAGTLPSDEVRKGIQRVVYEIAANRLGQ